MKNRVIAAGAVVAFFGLLNTNADPKMWQIAIIAVGIYEAVLLALDILDEVPRKAEKRTRKRQHAQNEIYRQEEGERLDEAVLNPLRRMREVS